MKPHRIVLGYCAIALIIAISTMAGGITGVNPSPVAARRSAPRLSPSLERDRMAIEAGQVAVVEYQKQRIKQVMVDRLTAYMRATNTVQGLIDLAPLMVDLGEQTGNDARICPVTAVAESSGGRVTCGSCNPFGALGMSFGSWEAAVRYYFRRITEFGFNGDVYHIAKWWYGGGSSMGGKAESYAANILNSVNSI
jgi:hypothetical protein